MTIGDADFGVQVGIGVAGRMLTAIIAFGGSIILARVLGPAGYGTFYLLMAIVAFLDNPVKGWATACRKRLTELDFPASQAVGATLLAIVGSSIFVFVFALFTAPLLTELTGDPNTWLFLGALFLGSVTYSAAQQLLKATKHFGSSTWLEASRDSVRVLVQAGFVLTGYGVAGMVLGMVTANLLVAPVVVYLVGAGPKLPSRQSLGDIWSFARSSIPSGIVGTAQQRIDLILLGAFVGTGAAGIYEIAFKLTIPAMFVAGVAQNGLMGRISNLQSRGEPFIEDIENNLAYASVIGIPVFFGALSLARPIVVTVYGSDFSSAAPYLIGLAFFRLLRTQKVILVSTVNGLDRPDLNLRISTGVFALNVVLGLGMLFTLGPIGVVIATVISEAVGYTLRARVVKSLIPSVDVFPGQILSQMASGTVMAIVVFAGREALPLGSWQNVAILVALGGVIYFGTLALFSEPFRGTVRAVAKDAGFR